MGACASTGRLSLQQNSLAHGNPLCVDWLRLYDSRAQKSVTRRASFAQTQLKPEAGEKNVMRARRRLIGLLVFLACLSVSSPCTEGLTKSAADERQMLEPSELFRDFPALRWGMSFQDAKKAIERTGAQPVSRKARVSQNWSSESSRTPNIERCSSLG